LAETPEALRIVVADDAAPARAILARLIGDLGHEVVAEATDAIGLLTCCSDLQPDLAVVDGRLPPEGGLVAVESLHRADPDLTILVVASLVEVELLRLALVAGASGALGRPFLRSQIEATLRRFARTE
jgi:two-component system chemotaxis response regulator CheY